jgi:hypothetical protein
MGEEKGSGGDEEREIVLKSMLDFMSLSEQYN